MGFGISQEIFKETYQHPPDCRQRDTGRDEITASWAYIHWVCPDLMGANMLPLAEYESHSCEMPKPITHAKPE